MEAPKIDKHNEKWCGYFKNEDEAQKHLENELKNLYSKLVTNPLDKEDIRNKVCQEDINHVLDIIDKLENVLK